MIISRDKKIVVYLLPRTGTSSLTATFKNSGLNLYNCNHDHMTLARFREYAYEIGDGTLDSSELSEYRHFCFYREPLSRAISVINYLRRGAQCSKFYHAFYGDSINFSCASRVNYNNLSDELKALNDAVPMIEVFRKFKWYFERGPYATNQKRWLDYPEMELLNFHDYENEFAKLCAAFDLDPASINRVHMNESISIPELDVLSASEEQEIKNYIQEDYEFFESRGISFT